jgi:hypothetical protein
MSSYRQENEASRKSSMPREPRSVQYSRPILIFASPSCTPR